jgi:PAS domain S-box-containing protein
VIATNVQGEVVLMNSVAEGLTGWSESEARGKTLTEVFSSPTAKVSQGVSTRWPRFQSPDHG